MQRQDWPTSWLLTDERMGDQLLPAIDRAAAAGAGIIVRHYASPAETRARIAEYIGRVGAVLGVSRDTFLAREWGADFVHNPAGEVPDELAWTQAVHDDQEALAAAHQRPRLVFISPVFATRSHPGAPSLGEEQALKLTALTGCPSIALGGMNATRGAALMKRGFFGWAGIDCWLRT